MYLKLLKSKRGAAVYRRRKICFSLKKIYKIKMLFVNDNESNFLKTRTSGYEGQTKYMYTKG